MSEKGLEKRVYMFTTQGADEKVHAFLARLLKMPLQAQELKVDRRAEGILSKS